MGAAYETVMVQATAPGTTVTAYAAQSPGSLTVRSTAQTTDIRLLAMWSYQNGAGIARLHSPRMHDNVEGIRQQVLATQATPTIPQMALQRMYPQDTLVWEGTGSATAGDIETGFFSLYYQDLPGVAARFIDQNELARRGVNIAAVEIDTTPGTAGGWSGGSALNKTKDQWKANTDYAVLGATFSATSGSGAIAFSGPDTGNLYVGMPAETGQFELLQEYFVRLTIKSGIPLIPVVNAANKAGTLLYVGANEDGTAVNVSLIVVELAPSGTTSPTARPAGA